MNPFLSVWLHPKQTARYVIEHKPIVYALILLVLSSMLSGSAELFNTEAYPDLSFVWIFLISIILVPIIGITFMFITTGIVFLIGKLLNGTGSFWDVFKASSISSIPAICTAPFFILGTIVDEVSAVGLIVGILTIVTSIWAVVILVAAIAEAHQFSIIRSIITLIIPTIILVFLLIGIVIIIMVFFAVAFDSML